MSRTVTGSHGAPIPAEQAGGLRVGEQLRAGIAAHEIFDPSLVTVVGMLVSDDDRIETGDALETVGKGTRIEQHPDTVELEQKTGMAKVREAHTVSFPDWELLARRV